MTASQAVEANEHVIDGLLVSDEKSVMDYMSNLTPAKETMIKGQMDRRIPFLVLVFGGSEAIPPGMADELHRQYAAHPVEVVRFFLMQNGERAIIGGESDGYWVPFLRRLAAGKGIISLVCHRVEVDEIAAQLVNYLRFKQRFFLRLARRYEPGSLRLELISQALGMDERIGQGWLYHEEHETAPMKEIEHWLQNKIEMVLREMCPTRVVISGYRYQINRWSAWLRQHDPRIETCAYYVDNEEKTNEGTTIGLICHDFAEMVKNAELLIIAASDNMIQELHLEQLTRLMKHPIVIDARSLFPVDEAKKFGITYVTYGQNTNDRNENYTGRK